MKILCVDLNLLRKWQQPTAAAEWHQRAEVNHILKQWQLCTHGAINKAKHNSTSMLKMKKALTLKSRRSVGWSAGRESSGRVIGWRLVRYTQYRKLLVKIKMA